MSTNYGAAVLRYGAEETERHAICGLCKHGMHDACVGGNATPPCAEILRGQYCHCLTCYPSHEETGEAPAALGVHQEAREVLNYLNQRVHHKAPCRGRYVNCTCGLTEARRKAARVVEALKP